jgi:hypothetical protein
MSIVKEKNRYVPYLNGNRFIPANDYSIATYEEMQTFINNMDSPTLSIDGSNIIMNFTPFPEKYVNYISQHQEIGIRKQVFIQLVS